ncbi:hypothetical protein Tco_1135313 [Tanacetum coccineum]
MAVLAVDATPASTTAAAQPPKPFTTTTSCLIIPSIFLLAWMGWNADIEGRTLGELCTYDKILYFCGWPRYMLFFVKLLRLKGLINSVRRNDPQFNPIQDGCPGYSTQLRAYRVYNKRTRVIVETIHVNFDELPQMASDHVSSDPVPQCLLFSLMFDVLFNGSTKFVSKSSAVHATDAPDQRQQHNTTPSTPTTIAADTPPLNIQTTPDTTSQAPTVTAIKNINQAETHEENTQVIKDEFINIFSTPVHEQGETSS